MPSSQTDFPNLDSSNDGYADSYQLRLYTSREGQAGLDDLRLGRHPDLRQHLVGRLHEDVSRRPDGHAVQDGTYGATVKLAAAVVPSVVTGTIEFLDGSKFSSPCRSSPVRRLVSTRPADGRQPLSAKFVPSGTRTSQRRPPRCTTVTVTARADDDVAQRLEVDDQEGQKLTLTAKENPAVAGSFVFYDGKTKLATVKAAKGVGLVQPRRSSPSARHALRRSSRRRSTANDAAPLSKS